MGRCWYCGQLGVTLTDEHVLSERNFGGKLIARKSVCAPCNSEIGKLERRLPQDHALYDLIAEHGSRFRPRLPAPIIDGILADGTEVRVQQRNGSYQAVSREPKKVETRGDGTEVWHVAASDVERVGERLRRDGVVADVRGLDPSDLPGLNLKWGIGPPNVDNWSRMAAKVGLSLASLVLPESWLDTPGASALQDVLHRRPWDTTVLPRNLPFGPGTLDRSEEPARLLEPTDHVVGLDYDEAGKPRAWTILFGGERTTQMPLPDAPVPRCEPTWLLRIGRPVGDPMPGGDLLAALRGEKP